MPPQSPRASLPFEPRQKKQKAAPKAPEKAKKSPEDAQLSAIPEAVSKRMIRRMALFCGIPTFLGLSSFGVFYTIVRQEWLEVPTSAVAAVSMGLFGLGVVGLSYGILSASWDEERAGSWFGWQEFTTNFGRTVNAWRSARKEAKQAKGE